MAWCPWQPNVLASGGGTADRHIRFWNANTGACLNSLDTSSQVCAFISEVFLLHRCVAHGWTCRDRVGGRGAGGLPCDRGLGSLEFLFDVQIVDFGVTRGIDYDGRPPTLQSRYH